MSGVIWGADFVPGGETGGIICSYILILCMIFRDTLGVRVLVRTRIVKSGISWTFPQLASFARSSSADFLAYPKNRSKSYSNFPVDIRPARWLKGKIGPNSGSQGLDNPRRILPGCDARHESLGSITPCMREANPARMRRATLLALGSITPCMREANPARAQRATRVVWLRVINCRKFVLSCMASWKRTKIPFSSRQACVTTAVWRSDGQAERFQVGQDRTAGQQQ